MLSSKIKSTSVDIIIPTFNSKKYIGKTLETLARQQLPPNTTLKIIVVDDGSNDGCAELIESECSFVVDKLVRLEKNRGRAYARNAGCAHGSSEYIILLDSDCVPANDRFIAEHLHILNSNTISCGALMPRSSESDFWSRYQQEVFHRRERQFNENNKLNFTTANLALSREIFTASSGFNEDYKYYGFEDLDFKLRCEHAGAKLTLTPQAMVTHDADLTLSEVGHKMLESGRYSAKIFYQQYPDYYSNSPYGRIDINLHPSLKPVAAIVSPVVINLTPQLNKLIQSPLMAYPLKKWLVKITSALYFLRGTSLQK